MMHTILAPPPVLSSSSSHSVLLSVAPWNYVMVACRVAWIPLQPQVALYMALAAFFLFSLVLLPGLRYIYISYFLIAWCGSENIGPQYRS